MSEDENVANALKWCRHPTCGVQEVNGETGGGRR